LMLWTGDDDLRSRFFSYVTVALSCSYFFSLSRLVESHGGHRFAPLATQLQEVPRALLSALSSLPASLPRRSCRCRCTGHKQTWFDCKSTPWGWSTRYWNKPRRWRWLLMEID
jgi:hypothetical protein